MPRPNKHRTIGAEICLSKNVFYLRRLAGITQTEVCRRMAAIGYDMLPSRICKIESTNPPSIYVDELYAFAQAFGVTIDDLVCNDIEAREFSWSMNRKTRKEATSG